MGVCFNIRGWNLLRLKNYCVNFESWWRGWTPSNQPIWVCVETSGVYRIRLLYPNFDDHHFSDEICDKDFQTSPYQDPFFDGSRGSKTWSYLLACFGKWKEFHYSYMFYLWFSSGIHQNHWTVLQTSPVCQFWDPHFETKFFSWWE